MSIILTSYAFPPFANGTTDPQWFPSSFSRNSHWGNWIARLYQRYDRFAPATPGITIDALEVVNEPNLMCKPQRNTPTGPVNSHQKVFEMFNTADQIGAERGHSLWLMGPALSDRQANSDQFFTYFESWMDLFFGLGFRGNSKWIWTHHNYIDCEIASGSAATARSKLIGKWSGYSDGDGPALFNSEGGSRLSRVTDQDRQRDTVINAFERGRTGSQSGGVGMFANYLLYDDPVTTTYSGLRNAMSIADDPNLAEHQRRGGRRKVYPSPATGTTGFRYLQTGPTTLRDWRGSEDLTNGGWLKWDPAVTSMRPGHLAAFGIGSTNRCYVNQNNGSGWSGWADLGGECSSAPAAVSRSTDIMEVMVRGPGDDIWVGVFSPAWWGGWYSLGGDATSDPAVCSMHGSHLEVFVRGPGNKLYHQWWYGGNWSGWHEFFGQYTWTSGPGAVSMANGRMDVFARGNDNQIYHFYFNGGWNGPSSIGAPTANGQTYATTTPRVCSWANRRFDVFARGPDGRVYRRIFDDEWGKWEPVLIFSGGPYGVAAESLEPGRIDLITVESSGSVYRWMYRL
jgi:hypothetical protein